MADYSVKRKKRRSLIQKSMNAVIVFVPIVGLLFPEQHPRMCNCNGTTYQHMKCLFYIKRILCRQ